MSFPTSSPLTEDFPTLSSTLHLTKFQLKALAKKEVKEVKEFEPVPYRGWGCFHVKNYRAPFYPFYKVPSGRRATKDRWSEVETLVLRVNKVGACVDPLPPFNVNSVESEVVQSILPRLFHTPRHTVEDRVKSKVNKSSKDGSYVEILPEEVPILCSSVRMRQWIVKGGFHAAEVGLNKYGQICKISITFPLEVKEGNRRYVFLCLGMDGAIRTLNMHPFVKTWVAYKPSQKIKR